MTSCRETARAKVNLALHVTGRRADGYHLLDTLVVFPDIGDTVTCEPAPESSGESIDLRIDGAFAPDLAGNPAGDNLVTRAAERLAAVAGLSRDRLAATRIHLAKELPVASGIGGGSADAAATLRALVRLWEVDVAEDDLTRLAIGLGADVPMCLASRTARATGIGEALTPIPGWPEFGIVLVNPRRPVSTPAVFRMLSTRDNPPLPEMPARFEDVESLIEWLSVTRNDLQPAAIALEPAIGAALACLDGTGAALARMSGSGATCFGLYGSRAAAEAAARAVRAERPGWWVAAGMV